MKKTLIIGLVILIGTNLLALAGVAYNRMGEATSQLILTERELSLPHQSGAQKENSGTSLGINWRTASNKNTAYYHYNARDIEISPEQLSALGFEKIETENNKWLESRELYWALEFDGELHKAEIENAKSHYQTALAIFEADQNKENKRNKNEAKKDLAKEKNTNSRLFFITASKDYESLAAKFSEQQNTLIVKGLAKPTFNHEDNTYWLVLQHLLVSNIMLPLKHAEVLTGLTRINRQDINPPRYAVDLKWGSRLEPWVVDVKKLD